MEEELQKTSEHSSNISLVVDLAPPPPDSSPQTPAKYQPLMKLFVASVPPPSSTTALMSFLGKTLIQHVTTARMMHGTQMIATLPNPKVNKSQQKQI